MPRNGRNYQIPMPYLMDSNVRYFPWRRQKFSRTNKIPYVEIQSVLPERKNEGACEWESAVGKLALAVKSLYNQMEGASEHLTKSTSEIPHTVGARPYVGLVYAGRGPQGQLSRLLSVCPPDLPGVDPIGEDKNTSTRGSNASQLFNCRATHRPRERGRLRDQPLHKYICVGRHPGWAY